MSADIATCSGCGCTDLRACPGGCSWLGVNRADGTGVCSRCPKALTAWRAQRAEHAPGPHIEFPLLNDAQLLSRVSEY